MKLEEGVHPIPLSNAQWVARGSRVLVGNVLREELVFRKGRGAWLYDVEGWEYLLKESFPRRPHIMEPKRRRKRPMTPANMKNIGRASVHIFLISVMTRIRNS